MNPFTTAFDADCPFTQEQMNTLIPAITQSIMEVKDMDTKTWNQINGDIFTNMRRNLKFAGNDLQDMFNVTRTTYNRHLTKKRRWVNKLIGEMQHKFMSQFQGSSDSRMDDLNELRMINANINAGVQELHELNDRADECMGQLVGIAENLGL